MLSRNLLDVVIWLSPPGGELECDGGEHIEPTLSFLRLSF
jgi:hypothetical protein